jgi:uncharacterized cupredoxin-like copper-binding protein
LIASTAFTRGEALSPATSNSLDRVQKSFCGLSHTNNIKGINKMELTSSGKQNPTDWLMNIGLILGMIISVALFGWVLARMGVLSGMTGGETAVAVPATHRYYAKNMRFDPPEFVVQSGEEIVLLLDNEDFYAHSFDISALNLHIEMPANDQVMVEFVAPAPGIYEIYCGVPGHKDAGMVSTLVVEP